MADNSTIMSDEQLDREWKPSGRRPQSTMARSFSAELMDIFRIENSIADLDSQVDQRKQTVGKSNNELAAIEARLRDMEDRLRRSQQRPGILPARDNDSSSTTTQQQPQHAPPPPPKDESKSRPGTARASRPAPSSGNMPPTPGASEDGDGE